jgi:hypothetical protein
MQSRTTKDLQEESNTLLISQSINTVLASAEKVKP